MKNRRTHQGRRISLMLICVMLLLTVSAQAQKGKRVKKAEDDVELVCAGDGKTIDEAVKMALRSGLEQTYGTFVSSNTTILNDDLIKDEIVSLSTGNVKGYEIVSKNQSSDRTWNAVVKAVFSTGKLVSYVKSKGGSTELAGGLFAMYAKMEKMNEEAEVKIIQNLEQQINIIAPTVFDFSIQAEDPYSNYQGYFVPVHIQGHLNKNINNLQDVFHNTIQSLSLTPEEVIKRIGSGLKVYAVCYYNIARDDKKHDDLIDEVNKVNSELEGKRNNGVAFGEKSSCGHMRFRSIWDYYPINKVKTASQLEDFINNVCFKYEDVNNVYYLRTKELETLLRIDFLKINPIGSFVISDGKNTWSGEHLEMPRAHNRLFTCCFKKGELWFDVKRALFYRDLDQLSEVKEITIKPYSSF